MKRIKVLFISYSFPPAQAPAAQRVYSIVKYMDKNKFDIFVLTPKVIDSSLGFSKSKKDLLNEVKIIREGKGIIGNSTKIREEIKNIKKSTLKGMVYSLVYKYFLFPDKGLIWVLSIINKIDNIIKYTEPDIILSTSPLFTNHLIAYLINKRYRIPYITDFRDLHYIENISNSNIPFYLKNLHKHWEKKILENSSSSIFISESMKNLYIKSYSFLQNKSYTVYNGFDLSEFQVDSNMEPNHEKIRIFYAGSFYEGIRDPFPLLYSLEYLYQQQALPNIEINIAGNLGKDLLEKFKNLKINKYINYLGIKDREEVFILMKQSHFLWLIVADKISHKIGIPLKTFEYILSKRFILAFVPEDSEVSSIIKANNLGKIFYNKTDRTSIKYNAMILRELFNNYLNLYKTEPDFIKLKKFDRKYQAEQIEKIIENVVRNS